MSFIISALKIIFILGFLVLIHETGHFVVARICKVKVKEFAIGFGPTIWKKQGKFTKYALRLIPLGGFVSMEGEEEPSDEEGSFSSSSISKRIAIIAAGGLVNIIFGLIVYMILISVLTGDFVKAFSYTGDLAFSMVESIKLLFSSGVSTDQLTGIVGISEIIVETTNITEFVYIMAIISLSLGVTNLLPFPPLDGGKVLLLIIEAIRKKPLKQETEAKISLIGFSLIILLFIVVTYNDIIKLL